MRIIRLPEENPIACTCAECNTEFSFTLPEVTIKTWEEESGVINVRKKGLFKKEYWASVYKCKKAVVYCPKCNNEIKVEGFMEKALKPEKISERIFDKSELTTTWC